MPTTTETKEKKKKSFRNIFRIHFTEHVQKIKYYTNTPSNMAIPKNCAATVFMTLRGAKVLCILHHRGVHLKLAYSWARPAILVAGKGRGGSFSSVSSLSFLFLFLPCSSLHLYYLFYLFFPFSGRWHKGWRVVKPQHNKLSWVSSSGEW